MKDEGKGSKAPLSEAFGQWKNAKIALLALLGLTAGQAVVWYNGQFYALFFLQNVLKVDAQSVNIMIAIALALGSIFFVVFGWLSDKIGRKPIIMAGLALAIVCTFPLFKALTWAANPALATAQQNTRATVTAAPGDCKFQFNPVGTAKFTTSCDIATSFLTKNSVPYDVVATAAPGTAASVKIGNETVDSYDAIAAGDQAKAKDAAFVKAVNMSLQDGGYPLKRAAIKIAGPEARRLHRGQSGTEARCRRHPRRREGNGSGRPGDQGQAPDQGRGGWGTRDHRLQHSWRLAPLRCSPTRRKSTGR